MLPASLVYLLQPSPPSDSECPAGGIHGLFVAPGCPCGGGRGESKLERRSRRSPSLFLRVGFQLRLLTIATSGALPVAGATTVVFRTGREFSEDTRCYF